MNNSEFSDAFDVLLNSHSMRTEFGIPSSVQDIVLDEYEKSIYLTKAQKQIVVELYTGRNERGASFESTEELRACLRNLIKEESLTENEVSEGSRTYSLPEDLLFIIHEEAVIDDSNAGCLDSTSVSSVPVTYDELSKVLRNPFRKPSKDRVLRVDEGSGLIKVYSLYNIGKYSMKYLRNPSPIILSDIDGMSIDGCEAGECELDSITHDVILERAVRLALIGRSHRSNV